ncbi:hypothetical protein [Telluribacter sp. SYSU D00476]|uniref:hypothetical protein n=1 Tax=Telluribacter sp. SYSU D00476 TaxID=2811430 RepID=UPI001FF171CD|nr:hypothetical protein [Telluribacter sp. SYSU D00476]
MKKTIILCLLLSHCFVAVRAQSREREPRKWPLMVSVFSEAWALPSTQLVKSPIHPGLSVGTSYTLRQTTRSTVSLNGTLGYFYHKNIQNNLHLLATLGYQHRVAGGLHVGTALGLGYSHSVYPIQVYQLEGGEYQKATDWGKSALAPSFELNLGYTIHRHSPNPVTVFTRYQLLVEWPYAPENTFPALPHTLFHVGAKFYPFN